MLLKLRPLLNSSFAFKATYSKSERFGSHPLTNYLLGIYIYQTLLSKAAYSAFRLCMFLSVHVISGIRTHNLYAANAML